MSQMHEVDVAVIGGGIAGMVAATRAAQLGKSVAVLEKGSEEQYFCNSRFTGGTFHLCATDVMTGADELLEIILNQTAGFARPALAKAVADDGGKVVRWLQSEGGKFIKATSTTIMSYKSWVLAPPAHVGPGLHWRGRSGDVLLQTLERNLVRRKGRFFRGTRAMELLMEGRRCIGVSATTAAGPVEFRAGATVIADGGFQANADLVRENISRSPEKLRQRGGGTGIGDGLRMAKAVGAELVGLDRFYGHPLSIDAFTNDRLWPYPYLDPLTTAAIAVDARGERFVDEGHSGVYIANAIARLDDPLSANLIFDSAIWDEPGCDTTIPPNPHLKNVGATMHIAPNLEALAVMIHVPAAALSRTVFDYNAAIAGRSLDTLSPPRRSDLHKPWPIVKAPFYAVPMCAGITYTMGGIVIDEFARVLDTGGSVIPGLFAAGTTTGGLEGGPAIGYVGGLVRSSVMGFRAAEKIVAGTA